ncbi:DNA-directed RNA polymerase [Candidatus Woesearchaeota archaeon]|nr:DNA-directed RNA polymerase [Candidatus Woesearchaeota archaeon]
MFYNIKIQDHIRVPPKLFSKSVKESVIQRIRKKYDGFISKEFGIVIDVADIDTISEGVIIPGDGASYYDTTFDLFVYRPELQEIVLGNIRDIADFGAFINLGPIEGMIHVSQTMDDFVSFSKEKVLNGKETKRSLRVSDRCKARIIAVSYKDVSNPKLGLTMRQPQLGRLDWIEEDAKPKEGPAEKAPAPKKESKKEEKK